MLRCRRVGSGNDLSTSVLLISWARLKEIGTGVCAASMLLFDDGSIVDADDDSPFRLLRSNLACHLRKCLHLRSLVHLLTAVYFCSTHSSCVAAELLTAGRLGEEELAVCWLSSDDGGRIRQRDFQCCSRF